MENFGLNPRELAVLQSVFKEYPEVGIVYIFGSRAKGNWKLGSDIDLAIMNSVSPETIAQLKNAFEESSLPYFVDIHAYSNIKDEVFKEHIDRVGKLFYASTKPEML